jgi:glutamate synthase domain-containing protein 2
MMKQSDEPESVAQYISAMTHELAQLAKRSGLAPLAYILDMARLEADEVSKSATRRPS